MSYNDAIIKKSATVGAAFCVALSLSSVSIDSSNSSFYNNAYHSIHRSLKSVPIVNSISKSEKRFWNRPSSFTYNYSKVFEGDNNMSLKDAELYNKNIEKLAIMKGLEDNWNEEGAPKFNQNLISNVEKLLGALKSIMLPNIFPTANSNILMEFHRQRHYLSLEVSEHSCKAYSTDGVNFDNDTFETYEYSQEKIISLVTFFATK